MRPQFLIIDITELRSKLWTKLYVNTVGQSQPLPTWNYNPFG